MDARPRDIELRTHQRLSRRYLVSDFLSVIIGDFGNHGGVHQFIVSPQGQVLHDERLYRCVARAFTQT